ncbi:unnamed protein product [Bursaphelenchus xylophilus]|uniref:(pine wood nematode) hypothetical protein n=1 Tax=Bursaphelenchus xylophilus TaxID=6326 RepID=A0A1I7SLD4_BURXY|nr:unnamed protein product [Bursaphelenchus xylophilus]CAG9129511.1 unnamed protein product [Bursaphelenchus xylophilus]
MDALTTIEWIDRLVILIETAMTVLFLLTVVNCRLLHPNLRFFLCQIVVPLNLVGVTRLLADLADELHIFHFSGYYCIVISTLNMIVTGMADCVMIGIITERFIATLNRTHYEQISNKYAKVYSCIIFVYGGFYVLICEEFSYSLHAVFPDQCNLIDMYPGLDAQGFRICGVTVVLCTGPAFALYLYNRKLFNNRQKMESLSSRFQLNENFMVMRTLIPVYIVCFIIIGNLGLWTIQVAAILSAGENWREHRNAIRILVKISHIAVDSVDIGFEATFVLNHPVLRNKAKCLLSVIIPQRVHPNKGNVYVITTRNGKQMCLSADADEYFKQLENTWKIERY